MRPFPTWYTMLIGICSQVVWGIQPMLSSPGNTTILVLIDVHHNYDNNGTCTDPIWEKLELAYSLWYNHDSRNGLIGLEIYDGCSSLGRTVSVLRHRLFLTQTTVGTQAIVASIVTYIKPEIDDAISGTVLMSGASHVTLGSPLQHVPEQKQTNGHIYIDLSPRSSIEVLHTMLRTLNWTYLTVLSDVNPHSKWKHQQFLLTKDDTTCVQESLFNASSVTLESLDVITDGVLMFASTSKTNISALPLSTSVLLVTQDIRFARKMPKRQGVVLTEDFGSTADTFVEFLSGWLQSPLNDLFVEYFTSQHGCSLDTTTGQTQCPDLESLKGDVRSTVSTKHFVMASKAVNALSQTLAESVRQNCTSFQAPTCFDLAGIERLFEASDMSYWVAKPSINVSITWLANEDVISSQMVEIIDTTEPGSNLTDALDNLNGFPESRCSGWCPVCKSDGCDDVNQTPFAGNHAFTAGDIIIAGMFPLTRHLELGPTTTCSGFSIGSNTDVIVEAFLYAIQTAQSRYSGLLRNLTIGSLVMDTCSDTSRATQTIMNFESCQYNLGNDVGVTPAMVPAYITYKDNNAHKVDGLEKLQLSVTKSGKIYKENSVLFDDALFNQDVFISILRKMEWTHVGIVTSASSRRDINVGAFYDVAASNEICIGSDIDLTGDYSFLVDSIETIRKSSIGVFVMFADNDDVDAFFRVLLSNPVTKTWIVVGSRQNWYDFNSVILPSGSLLLQGKGKLNPGFNSYLKNKIQFPSAESSYKSWLSDFQTSRDNCTGCTLPDRIADKDTKLRASDVIRAVDVTLHAIDVTYRNFCASISGPCRDLYTKGFNEVPNSMSKVNFDYEGDTIDLMVGYQIMENYPILNIQSSMIVEIGSWSNGKLELDKSRYKAYGSSGDELRNGRRSACYTRCECLNIEPNNGTSGGIDVSGVMMTQTLDPEMGFMDSSGEFNKELWCIVVVIIAGSGAFATVCLMVYVMSKVCAGALVRRYLALGLMLLVAMVFLFMSVLPFVFTPSEAVCGMRYFAHGFSYALCFAIVLTKMTTLRNYRYIGLGGEISRINQLLSVFFITGVQVAIGIEWWALRTPVVYTEANSTLNGYELTTHYACDFKRGDFLAYHSYVIFLVCVCCAYSIGVRKETNNMKEARLLLISSWVSFVIWIAIILTLSVMERDHLEAICSVGILANALTLMVVIYFPKLTVISQLKYEVSDGKSAKANGYKIDADFQFETVYSVPGTLSSGVMDKSLSFPRTQKAFDSGLTY